MDYLLDINILPHGTSHVYHLNRLHFTDPDNLKTYTLKGYTSQEEALEEEKKLILKYKPKYNSQFLVGITERLELSYKDIEHLIEECNIEQPNNKILTAYEKIEEGKTPSIQVAVAYYTNPNTDNEILFRAFPEFTEWLEAGVTPQNMNTINNRKKIEDLASSLKIMSKVTEVILPFKLDTAYTKTKIKTEIQKFYDSKNIKLKAKATDINKWYITKSTKNIKGENCFKLISNKEIN